MIVLKNPIDGFDPTKPTVFLDIDGVLNSEMFFRYQSTIHNPSITHGDTNQFDPKSIEILNEICDWNFVLSSTWRRGHTLLEMNSILKEIGFKGVLIGSTPIFNESWSLRRNEIYSWIKNNIQTPDTFPYVILDDDSDMLYWQRNHLFLVDRYCGVTPNTIYRMKRFIDKLKF